MNSHINKRKPLKMPVSYGDTPVLRTEKPLTVAVSDLKPAGLRERIKTAKSGTEVTDLLNVAAGFAHASPKTIRRWERAAKTRIVQLGTVGA